MPSPAVSGFGRADPPVVLADRVVVVALPSVAEDEDVRHRRGWSASAASAASLAIVPSGVAHLLAALVVRDQVVLLGLAGDAPQ